MRKPAAILAAVAIGATALSVGPAVQSASALSAGVSFSAENLPTWQANGIVWSVGQSKGKVVAGGTFTEVRPPAGNTAAVQARSNLAIFNAETGNPDSCQLNVTLAGGTATVRSVITAEDGTVYIGGNFSNVGGVSVSRVAAIDVQACTVKPLRVSGVSSFVHSMAVSGNSLYLAGSFTSVAGQPRQQFAAVNATTGAVLPFIADSALVGRAATAAPDGRALAVSPDGSKVALGGEFDTINGADSHSIAVVDAVTGAIVKNYPTGFINTNSITKTLHTSGNTLYGGNEGTGGGVFDGRFAIDWGTLDQKWRDTCLGATQAVLVYKDTLYAASHAHNCASMNAFQDGSRNYFNAQSTVDGKMYQWGPRGNDGIGEGIGPRAMTVATGATTGKDYLWYGGEFTQVNGVAQQSLTRFGPDDNNRPPTPSVVAEPLTSGAIQVRFRTVVDTDDSDLTYSVYRNGGATPIWTGTVKSMWWTRPQVTFVDSGVVAGTSYGYRVTASDGKNVSALSATSSAVAQERPVNYPTQVIKDGAKLFWRYDEASGAWIQDKSGDAAGKNGLAVNGLTMGAAGALANDTSPAATFDGIDDYVWNDQLEAAPTTYSMETWFKTDTTTGGKIIGFGNGRPRTDNGLTMLSGAYDRHIYMENTGQLQFGVNSGGLKMIRSATAYNDNQWHHVVATQGSTGMNLYVDGLSVGRLSTTTAQAYFGVWHVGGDNLAGWPNRPTSDMFKGTIDETAVYGSVLTARQVSNHYVLGGGAPKVNAAPTDSYGAAVFNAEPDLYWRLEEATGTAASDSSYFGQKPGTIGAGVQLAQRATVNDGKAARTGAAATSMIASPLGANPSQFATEAWIKTATTTGGKIIGFENTATGNGTSYDKATYMTNTGQIVFGTYSAGVRSITTTRTFNDDKWHHIVSTQDLTGQKLYVDGRLEGTHTATTNQTFDGYWKVGGGNLTNWPGKPTTTNFTGTIDEVAVYAHGLSASDVASHYAAGLNDTVAPSVPAGVTATVAGSDVTVSWTASTDANGVASYQVHRGITADFAVSKDSQVASVPGLNFKDAALTPGSYYYKVIAVDGGGNASAASASVKADVKDTAAPSVPADVAASIVAGAPKVTWSASTDNAPGVTYQVHRGATADFAVSPTSTPVGTATEPSFTDTTHPAKGTYFYKVVAVDAAGNASAASAGASVIVNDTTAPAAPADVTTSVDGSSVTVNWSASTDDTAVTGYALHRGSSADFTVSDSNRVKEGVTGLTVTDADLAVGTYYYKVVALDAAGNASSASPSASAEVSDTTAPTAPSGLTATASGQTVTLKWTASTDAVGVTKYTVYRGASVGFTPDASSKVADVTSGVTYTDSNVAAGDQYYKVVASDAASNASAASDAAKVTVTIPTVPPTVVRLTPTEDSMVAQAAGATNYGTATYLASRGGTSANETYLRFSLPAAPAGKVLTGATLQVRTSTDAASASPDPYSVKLLTGTWDEATVTWNNRPKGLGATLGTFTATAINTTYTSTLDAAAVAALGESTASVGIVGTSTDNVRLWSSEAAAANRPVLILTYK
ncbi:MAG: hypothetical protein JWN06_3018 [Propionibacteriaceae bacterium]|nr:hypothetical protein [Propionibacteriaceae bacterium]